MKKYPTHFIINLLWVAIGIMFGIALLSLIISMLMDTTIHYAYTDFQGNQGEATWCTQTRGTMRCELPDRTQVQVMMYKRIDKR